MQMTPVIENFLNQCRQHEHVVSVELSDPTQDNMTQIKRTDVIRFEFVIDLDLDGIENVPLDFIVPIDGITEQSYAGFSTGLDSLLSCDCVITNPTHNDRVMRDINQSAFNNIGRTTYYIRPEDGWMVPIYGEYADEITPTNPVFLELIEKLKNVEHVLEVKVEELLDNSILSEEEQQVTHVFFRIKHTIIGTTSSRYAHFIMSEPSCCNTLEHNWAVEQLVNLIKAEPV
jgi:hypothetical protein